MSIAVDDLFAIEHVAVLNRARLRRTSFARVSTDTRTLKKGDLFIALRGERTDGHAYLAEAAKRGAGCFIVEDGEQSRQIGRIPTVIVRNTLEAMTELARLHRRRFAIPVIAVAGSNGKTTTKEMIGAVLRTTYAVHQTMGNLNNHIGVPLTIFGLTAEHEIAVVEVGTNHFGEVRHLCSILRPTHAVLTNIGGEHLEFFGSLSGVAREEGEVFRALTGNGVAFVNADDPRVRRLAARLRRRVTYGFSASARVRGTLLSVGSDGCALCAVAAPKTKAFEITPSLPGMHNATNALAAAAVGLTFRVPVRRIRQALRAAGSPGKRMEITRVRGIVLVNDTYNANADSVIGALETLKAMPATGKRILILGDMLELGAASEEEHRRVGRAIDAMGFRYLLTHGPASRSITAAVRRAEVNLHFEQKNLLAEYAAELVSRGDIILVKGSRGMRMEDVVFFLEERAGRKPV